VAGTSSAKSRPTRGWGELRFDALPNERSVDALSVFAKVLITLSGKNEFSAGYLRWGI
jgi:hypothetical protein